MSLVPKLAQPQGSPGTWPAFSRYLYASFKKTQVSDLGPLGPLVFESSYVAYQIKGNGVLSTMLAYILSLNTPFTCWGYKFNEFALFDLVLPSNTSFLRILAEFCSYYYSWAKSGITWLFGGGGVTSSVASYF